VRQQSGQEGENPSLDYILFSVCWWKHYSLKGFM
jgi:hypothetical protein